MKQDVQWLDDLECALEARLREEVKVMTPCTWALDLLSRLWNKETDEAQKEILYKLYFSAVNYFGLPPEFSAVLCCIYRNRYVPEAV